MITRYTHRHVKVGVVEQATCFLVYAVLLETTGADTVALAEPKLVKIIPKQQLVLSAARAASVAPSAIVSPFTEQVAPPATPFNAWYYARPPTGV
mgnify:CR=1 FL=1